MASDSTSARPLPPPPPARGGGEEFGRLPNGEVVRQFTLRNAHGLSLTVITYGGIVTQLHVPDRHGNTADVTLGYDTLEPYLKNPNFFGCITGRVAGRITNGRFTLDGKPYQLERNGPPHHIHGGSGALNTRLWSAEPIGKNALRLTYFSPDGECGYPGNLNLSVTYTLTDDNAWQIDYEATTDQPTPLNLTHHAYFNLASHDAGTVLDHSVEISADEYVPIDADSTLLGRRESVNGLPCDLRSLTPIGDVVDRLYLKHGDLYALENPNRALVPAARVQHARSGREMLVLTTEPMLQFYAGVNMAPGTVGKGGTPYPKHAALCLEAENYPDGVNAPALGGIILRPGQTYRQTTVYRFAAH